MTWTTLVDANSLADDRAADERPLAIIDARVDLTDRAAAAQRFAEAHIPGAVRADLEADLSGAHSPGAGRHPWPTDDEFARALGRLGITADHQVVVYDDAQGALAAARLWFMLKAWGHDAAAVLDGGWTAWKNAGLAQESGDRAGEGRRPYTGAFDRTRLVSTGELHGGRAGKILLLDARAAERFRGDVEPLDRKAGHIPGAANRPFADNLRDGRFKPALMLREEFEALLQGAPPSTVVASCGSGVTACHHLLAMEHAGLRGARLYTGSWSGWIEDENRPVAVG